MKLKINRKKWIRGEGEIYSYLLRTADYKMCCVGFYLKACGVKSRLLADNSTPTDTPIALPKKAHWLVNKDVNSASADILYAANDNMELSGKTREQRITKEFAKHDVEVEFVD